MMVRNKCLLVSGQYSSVIKLFHGTSISGVTIVLCVQVYTSIERQRCVGDGVFNDCQLSGQEFDDEVASINSQTNVMDQNASNDVIDRRLNSKDDDDNDDDDDDD